MSYLKRRFGENYRFVVVVAVFALFLFVLSILRHLMVRIPMDSLGYLAGFGALGLVSEDPRRLLRRQMKSITAFLTLGAIILIIWAVAALIW